MLDLAIALFKLSGLVIVIAALMGLFFGASKVVYGVASACFHAFHFAALNAGISVREHIRNYCSLYLFRRGPSRADLIVLVASQAENMRLLNAELNSARDRIVSLSGLIASLKQQLEVGRHGAFDPLYASVGLHSNAPAFLIRAARREFRKHLHPDTKLPNERVAATRQFQEAESAFETIWRARRL